MHKKVIGIFILLFSVFFFSGCTLKTPPSALQINTTPAASIFLDSKPAGQTPYQNSSLKAGEVMVRLIPESTTNSLVSWEGKIKLNAGVLTLVERDFSVTEAESSGQILGLEKIKDNKSSSLSVISEPDGAVVNLDGEAKGFAPLSLEKVSAGDHQIIVSKDGFIEKVVKAKTVLGYKLIVNVKLAQIVVLTPTPSVTLTPAAAGKVTGTPKATPTLKITAAPKPTLEPGELNVQIKETPTGWLRVRASASTTAAEVAKVNPGEKYPLLEEKTGWYKILYAEGKEGWISSQYATKLE